MSITNWIRGYFSYHQAIEKAKKIYNLDGKDLVLDPSGTLLQLCDYLGVTCSNDYLEMCSNKIFLEHVT